MKISLIAALLLALSPLAMAHEANHHAISKTAAALAAAAKDAPAAVMAGATATAKIDFWGIMKASAATHNHNKIVHFPLALGLAGVLFALMSYKFESFRSPSRWLLFLAALASVAAVLTGRAQLADIDGAMAKQVAEGHEMQGYISCGLLWLNWLLSFFPSFRKWSWLLLLMLAVVLCFTGMLGGALAHMQF